MTHRYGILGLTAALLLTLPSPASGQGGGRDSWLVAELGDQDVVVAITSVEYGAPDRWSWTTRYIHMFDEKEVRDHKRLLNNLTATISPGTAGGRLGAGYQCIYDTNKRRSSGSSGVVLLSEARAVLIRTWGQPLSTDAGRTLAGAELRTSLAGVVNIGVGYYSPLSTDAGRLKAFWGVHVGVGM